MLTIFTCPKPFAGHYHTIQKNAVRSWMLLEPKPEILLIGNDTGTAEICKEFDLIHIPDVACNEFGTPLVNSVFEKAELRGSNRILCYVNADIILMSDFLEAIKLVATAKTDYFLVGQRWDADIRQTLSFTGHWEKELRAYAKNSGRLHAVTGKDFFVFPRHFYEKIPPFALGRGTWDDWLVYQARKQKSAVVDLTDAVTIVHQNHDYAHVLTQEGNGRWHGEEAGRNKSLAGRTFFGEHRSTIADAGYSVIGNRIIKKSWTYLCYRFMYRFLSRYYMDIKRATKSMKQPRSSKRFSGAT
jgi:hypothetical protein